MPTESERAWELIEQACEQQSWALLLRGLAVLFDLLDIDLLDAEARIQTGDYPERGNDGSPPALHV